MAETTEMVEIISLPDDMETGKPEFFLERLTPILTGKAKNLPVFIVSITGVFRSGKSFLLNLMKTYLDYYAKHGTDKKWESSNLLIEGGGWARQNEAVTHGICMWNRPFIIKDIAVLLVDCQGTGDTQRGAENLDNLILYIGLQLSDVQILNLNSRLQADDLKRLKVCGEYAELMTTDGGPVLFNCLIFLVRNWESDDDVGEKERAFDDVIDRAKSSTIIKFGTGIRKAFRSTTTFALPHPGLAVPKSSEKLKQLTIDKVSEDFILTSKVLFRKLFLELPDAKGMVGRQTLRKFRGLMDRVTDPKDGKINIKSAPEALMESLINKAFIEAEKYHDMKMKEIVSEDIESEEELEAYLTKVVNDAVNLLENNKTIERYGDCKVKRKYLKLLRKKQEANEERKNFLLSMKQAQDEKEEYAKKCLEMQEQLKKLKAEQERLREESEQRKKEGNDKQQHKMTEKSEQFERHRRLDERAMENDRKEKKIAQQQQRAKEIDEAMAARQQEIHDENEKQRQRVKSKEELLTKLEVEITRRNELSNLNMEEKWLDMKREQPKKTKKSKCKMQ